MTERKIKRENDRVTKRERERERDSERERVCERGREEDRDTEVDREKKGEIPDKYHTCSSLTIFEMQST